MGRSPLQTGRSIGPRPRGFAAALLSLCLALGCAAWAQERSAFGSQIEQFTRSLAAQLSAKTPRGSALAIADFDTPDSGAAEQNLGYAVSEIVTQEVQRSGYFLLLEKKQLQQILKTLELQQSGLYDSDKAATIGKLIDAKYLMVGSITETAGFYRVSVRVVEVETGSIILSDAVELDAALLESAAGKYLPPRYRAFIGSSMSWFALSPDGLGTYSIGLVLGGSYQIARSQWLALETVFFFSHYGYYDSLASEGLSSYYHLLDAFVLLGEYGYRIPLSRDVSLQPTLGLGAVAGWLNSILDSSGDQTTATSFWASPAAQLRIDLVFLEKNPVSFYLGTGYFIYSRELSETNHQLATDVLLNGIKLEGALMVYF